MRGDRIGKAWLGLVVGSLTIPFHTVALGQASVLEQQRAILALRKAGAYIARYADGSGTQGLSIEFPLGKSPFAVAPVLSRGAPSVRTAIDYSALQHLESVAQLKRLVVRFIESDGSSLRYIRGLKELRSLSIDLFDLKGAGLSGLKDLPRLKEFALSGSEITDSDILPLASLSSLGELRLRCPKVTDAGIKKLRDALPRCVIRR